MTPAELPGFPEVPTGWWAAIGSLLSVLLVQAFDVLRQRRTARSAEQATDSADATSIRQELWRANEQLRNELQEALAALAAAREELSSCRAELKLAIAVGRRLIRLLEQHGIAHGEEVPPAVLAPVTGQGPAYRPRGEGGR